MQCIKESKIMLLGMAYKKDIDGLRELTALEIYDLLLKQQAKRSFHDPYVTYFKRAEVIHFCPFIYEIILVKKVFLLW